MPCEDCERNPKLRATVICPDPWREGAAAGQSSGAPRRAGRNEKNKSKVVVSQDARGGHNAWAARCAFITRRQQFLVP
jgi:hypothetical protein